jgi:hypothetical protein
MNAGRGSWYPTLSAKNAKRMGHPAVGAGKVEGIPMNAGRGSWYPTLSAKNAKRMGHGTAMGPDKLSGS